jgi:hypothetical protein
MRRILLVLTVVALMAAMMIPSAMPAFAFKGHPPPAAEKSCKAKAPFETPACTEAGTSPPPGKGISK